MKIQWDKRYTTIAIYCFLVILASSSSILIISNFNAVSSTVGWFIGILSPFIGGFAIAYMLNPIIMMFETKLLKHLSLKKLRRGISLLLTYSISIIFITMLIINIIPQLQSSITTLISNSTNYIDNINNYFLDLAKENPWLKEPFNSAADYLEELIKNSGDIIKNIIPTVLSITTSVSNILIAIVASIYLLAAKEKMLSQSRKMLFAFAHKSTAERLLGISSFTNDCFNKFISGQIYVSLITGTITFIVASFMGVPYPLIMAFIIAITNIIPFFGPIIGSVLCIFIVLLVNPVQALWFGIFIIILQQIDSNIISPRIIGGSIGLAPFWVMFSIIISGALFGFAGLVFGVPLFTVIYSLIRITINDKLAEKGLPANETDYYEKYEVVDNHFRVPDEIKKKRMFKLPFIKKKNNKSDIKEDSSK